MDYHKQYYQNNKEAFRERNKRRYKEKGAQDREVWRDTYYRKNYGITLEQYNTMLITQNNVCAICKLTCSRRLSVDHCHKTGKVRGLLCIKCNRGLGNFNDEISRLKAAVNYMEN